MLEKPDIAPELMELMRERGIPNPSSRAEIAQSLHEQARALANTTDRGIYEVGLILYFIRAHTLWRDLDPELRSFREYLEKYKISGWSRSKAYTIVGQIEDLVKLGKSAREAVNILAQMGWTKFKQVRPALTLGLVDIIAVIEDASVRSHKELAQKYRDLIKRTSAEDVPDTTCYDCIHLWVADSARSDMLVAILEGEPPGIVLSDVEWRYCQAKQKVWIRGPSRTEAIEARRGCSRFKKGG